MAKKGSNTKKKKKSPVRKLYNNYKGLTEKEKEKVITAGIIIALVLVVGVMIAATLLSAGKNPSSSEVTDPTDKNGDGVPDSIEDTVLSTPVGDITVEGLMNIDKYENEVMDKTELEPEKQDDIDRTYELAKAGLLQDSTIDKLVSEFGSVEEYKEQETYTSKKAILEEQSKQQALEEGILEVTDADREDFASRYTDIFAHDNTITIIFPTWDDAYNYKINCEGKTKADILNYMATYLGHELSGWQDINLYEQEKGVFLMYSAFSDKYFYVESKDELKTTFDSLQDGQMSEPFPFFDGHAIMLRISSNSIELDDAAIDEYITEIKTKQAYQKYILDNR